MLQTKKTASLDPSLFQYHFYDSIIYIYFVCGCLRREGYNCRDRPDRFWFLTCVYISQFVISDIVHVLKMNLVELSCGI